MLFIIELFLLIFLLLFEAGFIVLAVLILVSGFISDFSGAPYVPLPKNSIKEILEFGEIEKNRSRTSSWKSDFCFYDLGSGDGRVLIEAVKNFGIEGVGYEISPWPYLKAKFLVHRLGLSDKIKIFRQNFFKADLSEADFVHLYLFPQLVQKLALKFRDELKPGAKVLCVSFKIENPGDYGLVLKKEGRVDRFNLFLYEKI